MQITTSQPETLMLYQNVAASAHKAILAQRPDLAEAEAEQARVAPQSLLSRQQPTNSIDILI